MAPSVELMMQMWQI